MKNTTCTTFVIESRYAPKKSTRVYYWARTGEWTERRADAHRYRTRQGAEKKRASLAAHTTSTLTIAEGK